MFASGFPGRPPPARYRRKGPAPYRRKGPRRAVRLLGLDPYRATAVLARLAPDMDRVAERAAGAARDGVDALPAASAPLLDLTAEQHASWPVRLFAS